MNNVGSASQATYAETTSFTNSNWNSFSLNSANMDVSSYFDKTKNYQIMARDGHDGVYNFGIIDFRQLITGYPTDSYLVIGTLEKWGPMTLEIDCYEDDVGIYMSIYGVKWANVATSSSWTAHTNLTIYYRVIS